jgi:protein-L-isoaspartate(D-aspartate) O-methyltransferase
MEVSPVSWTDYKIAREKMVTEQLIQRGIQDERVIHAMLDIPRHLFLDKEAGPQAYSDHAFPIGFSQTMSRPYTVAYLAEGLELQGNEKVLEIGTGCGYQAAVLSRLAAKVYSIERIEALAARAEKTLSSLGIDNVSIKVGDGTAGWPECGLFDRVLFTAAARSVSHNLLDQLRNGGFLLGPVETEDGKQHIVKMTKEGDTCSLQKLKNCAFVPMIREGEVDNSMEPIFRGRPEVG